MKKHLLTLLLAGIWSTANAQTITIGDTATIAQDSDFGGTVAPNASSGEFFTTPTNAGTLTSLTFQLEQNYTGHSSEVQAYAVAYNSTTGASGTLYTSSSAPVTVVNAGYTPYTFNFNVPVAANSTYIVFLSSVGLTQGAPSNEVLMGLTTTPTIGSQQLATATLASLTTGAIGNNFSLNGSYDAYFSATFLQMMNIGLNLNGLTPNQQAVGAAINAGLANGNSSPGFTALTNALFSAGNATILGGDLDQLTSLNFAQFSSSNAFNNASFLTQQFDNYLANHLGADGTFVSSPGSIDYSGLTVNDPTIDSGLQLVHSRLLAWNPAPSTGLLSDVANPMLSGVDMKDIRPVEASEPQNPWNFFISGDAVLAQNFSDASAGTAHSDATTGAVQIGADYRVTPQLLVGATAGYGHTDATLDTHGSNASVDTYAPGLYASYANSGWYVNALGSYGFSKYDQNRNVSIGSFGGTAHSSPGGDQTVGNLDGGYDFHQGGWTFGPTAGVQYTHLDVNGYTESGLAGDDLTVNANEADSLRSRLGGRVNYALRDGDLVFIPHLSASWQHEFMNQSRGITSQFNGLGVGSFVVNTPNPSRDSALLDLGLDAQLNRTWTVFADYSAQAGQSNYFGQSVQAGVKVGF